MATPEAQAIEDFDVGNATQEQIEAMLADGDASNDITPGGDEEQVQAAPAEEEAKAAAELAQDDIGADAPQESTAQAEKKPEGPKQAPKGDGAEEPAGITTKDGKHYMDYSVLEKARKSEQASKVALEAAQAEMEQLKEQLAAKSTTEDPGDTDGSGVSVGDSDFEARMEALKERYPEDFTELLGDMYAEVKALKGFKAEAEARQAQDIEADQAKARSAVADAVEQNATLSHWMENEPEAWRMAQQNDAVLRESPAWKDKPLSERFEQAAAMTKLALPNVSLPKPIPGEGNRADPNAEIANAKADVPGLSDIPTGASPGGDLEGDSYGALEEMYSNMTDEQMAAHLDRNAA